MSELKEIIQLLTRIATALEQIAPAKKRRDGKAMNDERVAAAVIAISRGANTFQEVAKAIGVSRSTVSRNHGIRRAMETALRDRSPASREAADEHRWERTR